MVENRSTLSKIVYLFILLILFVLCFATLYPFIYTLSLSVSDPLAVMRNQVTFLPIGFSFKSYMIILEDNSIWQSYYNTIWYTLVGTALNLIITIMGGYALSRKHFSAVPFVMVLITIPMFFGGGMVPNFILVNLLGLYNTRWAIVLPMAASSWNIIITKVFFQASIPDSIPEAAKIDGANDMQTFLRIIIPVSQPIIALITLYAAVGFWNSYFPALVYLSNTKLMPMTIMLRKLLNLGQSLQLGIAEGSDEILMYAMQIKYSAIIVTILPIICVYPFLQKYFVKGVMLGAIKE